MDRSIFVLVFVLVLSLGVGVYNASAGTLGVNVNQNADTSIAGTTMILTWSHGCLFSGRNLPPHSCDPLRPAGSVRYCPETSTGTSATTNNNIACSCNNDGRNNWEPSGTTCTNCDPCDGITCPVGQICQARDNNNLCAGGSECFCSSGACDQDGTWNACVKSISAHNCENAPGTRTQNIRRCVGGICQWTTSSPSACTVNLGSCPSPGPWSSWSSCDGPIMMCGYHPDEGTQLRSRTVWSCSGNTCASSTEFEGRTCDLDYGPCGGLEPACPPGTDPCPCGGCGDQFECEWLCGGPSCSSSGDCEGCDWVVTETCSDGTSTETSRNSCSLACCPPGPEPIPC